MEEAYVLIGYDLKGKVAVLTIQSPPANALSSGILKALNEHLDRIERDKSVKAVVLHGEGKFFSAGADIKEFTELQNANDYEELARQGQDIFNRVENFSIPVIAAIHGAALGGGLELAMSCHIRIVSATAKLGLPELSLGIIPGFAGTQRLPSYVGSAKAYEMILTGEPISGEEAAAAGLANRAVADGDVFSEAMNLAEKITLKSRQSINEVMRLIPFSKTGLFKEGVREEAKAFGNVFGTADAAEGIKAFIEKRKPNFQDK